MLQPHITYRSKDILIKDKKGISTIEIDFRNRDVTVTPLVNVSFVRYIICGCRKKFPRKRKRKYKWTQPFISNRGIGICFPSKILDDLWKSDYKALGAVDKKLLSRLTDFIS